MEPIGTEVEGVAVALLEEQQQPAVAPRVPARTAVLAVGTFAIGTDAFVVSGILPDVAHSLRVSVSAAGQLVTVFALAYAVLAPVTAVVTGNWPRRRVLLTALAVFVLANVATALAPTYGWVLAARVLAAVGASMFTPLAGATAAAIAPPERRAGALAVVTLGATTSYALGGPIGTVLGAAVNWRGSMWFVAALGVVAAAGVAALLPDVPAPPRVGLRQRFAPMRDGRTLLVLLTSGLLFIGIYMITIYVSVIFGRATGGDGRVLAMLLFLAGLAGTSGTFTAGRFADRYGARRVIAVVSVVLTADCLAMPLLSGNLPGAVVTCMVYGVTAWAVLVPQQHRLVEMRPDAAPLAISLNASVVYLAVSVSGALGAGALTVVSGRWLPLLGAAFFVLGLGASEIAHRASRHV